MLKLNNEILIYIFTFLDGRTIVLLKKVCKRIDKITDRDYIWGVFLVE